MVSTYKSNWCPGTLEVHKQNLRSLHICFSVERKNKLSRSSVPSRVYLTSLDTSRRERCVYVSHNRKHPPCFLPEILKSCRRLLNTARLATLGSLFLGASLISLRSFR